MSNHTNSPDHMPILPLHNPSLAAQVIVSQALIDNGGIAPLAKNLKGNPTFCSPTDNLLTPCTRKLSAARKKHFNKLPKTVQLFPQAENIELKEEEEVSEQMVVPAENKMEDDDENPF